MKAMADASSLLTLEFMGLLEDTFSIMDIYTTSLVEDELKEIAGYNDEKSMLARNILISVREGKLKLIEVKNEKTSKYGSHNMCLSLCISGKIPIFLTDDADAMYFIGRQASQKGIKIRIAAAVVIELIKANKLAETKAQEKLRDIMTKRSWEGGILEVLEKEYLE